MTKKKKIFCGSDHGGMVLKNHMCAFLKKQGYEVVDKGTNSTDSCDYPDYIFPVAESVAHTSEGRGLVICTTGMGASMCANKVKGIRAALCVNKDQAVMSRKHNDANVLVFGAKYVTPAEAEDITLAWLGEAFEAGRHERRVNKIRTYERHVAQEAEQ